MGRDVAFIGAGNLAWHLAPALENVGYAVKEVYSRNPENANQLCNQLYEAEVKQDLNFSDSSCEIFIVAASDDALESIASEIILPELAMIAHTSGTQPLSILGYTPTEHIGVFYPLQTFSKDKAIEFDQIPICIEGDTAEILDELGRMGNSISRQVTKMTTADRRVLHLAAVFACNFTNHLLTISEEILSHRGLDFELLHPLIIETITKSLKLGPANSQTGPAIRQDSTVLHNHIQYLSDRDDLSGIYSLLSEHIKEHYHLDSQE